MLRTPGTSAAPLFTLAPDDEDAEELPASPAPAQPPAVPVSPRSALAGELAGHMARLLAAGDLDAARVVGDTMVRLLSDAPSGAVVVDSVTERELRSR